MNELKNRGVKDVLIICADGLTGVKEAIATAFPKTEYQRCIVHQVRNTLKYVPDKDRKSFATDLKTIYQAADEKKSTGRLRSCDRKMDSEISEFYETLERKLGCHIPDFQVLNNRQKGHLYDQRD